MQGRSAERVNGILKIEYLLDKKYPNYKELKIAVDAAVKSYNEQRPHMSLRFETPSQRYAAQNKVINILTKEERKKEAKKERRKLRQQNCQLFLGRY